MVDISHKPNWPWEWVGPIVALTSGRLLRYSKPSAARSSPIAQRCKVSLSLRYHRDEMRTLLPAKRPVQSSSSQLMAFRVCLTHSRDVILLAIPHQHKLSKQSSSFSNHQIFTTANLNKISQLVNFIQNLVEQTCVEDPSQKIVEATPCPSQMPCKPPIAP